MVALLGPADKTDKSDSQRYQFMQRTALDAGFDFFAPLAGREDSNDATIESIQRRAQKLTPTLNGIIQSHVPYQHWGINE